MKSYLLKKCIKNCDSLSESGISQESMFLLELVCKLSSLFAAHKLSHLSFSVSSSLCAPGSFFDTFTELPLEQRIHPPTGDLLSLQPDPRNTLGSEDSFSISLLSLDREEIQ